VRTRWKFGWSITYPVFRLLLGVKVHNWENVPQKGPLLIASNHMNFIDPPLVGHAARRECFYLAKEDLFKQSKFFTWLISYFNAIPIKRKGFDVHIFKETAKLLKKKQAVILFPEGTRSLKGKLLPFKTGVGMIAMKYKTPVVPTYIRNSHRPPDEWISRKSPLEVYFAPPLYPKGSSGNKADYEAFTNLIEEKVRLLAESANSKEEKSKGSVGKNSKAVCNETTAAIEYINPLSKSFHLERPIPGVNG